MKHIIVAVTMIFIGIYVVASLLFSQKDVISEEHLVEITRSVCYQSLKNAYEERAVADAYEEMNAEAEESVKENVREGFEAAMIGMDGSAVINEGSLDVDIENGTIYIETQVIYKNLGKDRAVKAQELVVYDRPSAIAVDDAVLGLSSEEAEAKGYTWDVSGGKIKITKYAGGEASITIPSFIEGKEVTSIGSGAFQNNTASLVHCPQGLESIDSSVFENMVNLKTVLLPESLRSIGGRAFARCTSLEFVTIPNKTSNIAPGVFDGCTKLKKILIEDKSKWSNILNNNPGLSSLLSSPRKDL